MALTVTATAIDEVLIVEPRIHTDERGYFFESFHQRDFQNATGLDVHFVQENQSLSHQGVLRGLHYQADPHAQGKLIRAICGVIFDVAVDIRADSPTFGAYVAAVLSAENKKMLWIPPGFAHGFLALSATAEVLYHCTAFYEPTAERALLWSDPQVAINWPIAKKFALSELCPAQPPNAYVTIDRPTVSEKDARAPTLDQLT